MAFYPINGQLCETLADLRGAAGTDRVTIALLGLNTITDLLGGIFRWDATSTAADDGMSTIAVTGVATGRWVRVLNSNTVKGNTTFLTSIGQSSQMITHNAGVSPAGVYMTSTGPSFLTNVWHDKTLDTASTFTIKFNPLAVATTISFDWLVIKF